METPSSDTPNWGIEPVPERLRVLGTFDGFLLWANLSVSLLVIVAGAFLVLPFSQGGLALSLPVAIAAIVAAAVVGYIRLGLGGLIGADARVPTMVLLRAPLGRRGSYAPTALNILQCLGWSVFELIVIATGASALSKQVLGFGGTAFWKILFGCVATAAVATGGALLVDLRNYQTFLYLLGSFFIPLFGVLLADWLFHSCHYEAADIFSAPAVRPLPLVAWLAGFCLYQWLYPNGPSWWTRIVAHTHPHALPWGGASLPSFAAAFLLTSAAWVLVRRPALARA